ncbi:MAG: ribosome-associated translation inhibitor RaiA [Calditrichia bacterium]
MELTITARHFRIQEDLKMYVEDKVQRLNRFYGEILDLEVVLGWEKITRYCEFRIKVNGKQIVVKEITDDIRKSFDLALDKAERQLKRYKEKNRSSQKEKAVSA